MIELNNIYKKIENEMILTDISLILKEGNVYGFVGRNGSGKSMLFKCICGLIIPNKGNFIINGIDIFKEKTFPPDTRALIERPNFLLDESGFENLKMLAGIQGTISDIQINEVLEKLELLDVKDKPVKKYSLGMKQKLGIAQVLMEDPLIMIFDEPFSGLDELSVKIVRDIIALKRQQGKIILLSSHIKEDIQILCDEVFTIDSGKIIEHIFKENK